MKKLWRVLYPIAIYMGITMVISVGSLLLIMVLTGVRMASGADVDMDDALEIYNQCVLLITMVSALVTLPLHLWLFKRDRIMRADVKNPWKCGKNWGFLILLGIGACIAGNNLITLSGLDVLFQGYEAVSDGIFSNPMWFQILSVGIVIPIVEELTFRALGYRRLRDSMSFYWAAVISALCFGVFHGNVVQGVYAFGLGYLMAWVYERYDSFAAPVLLHCIANTVSVLLTMTALGEVFYHNTVTLWISTIIMILLTAGCIRFITQRVTRRQEIEETMYKEEDL